MIRIRRVCVFCGSHVGARPEYAVMARRLGKALAKRDIGLVYGGAAVGLMGVVANAVLSGGGEVHGVIPGGLAAKEIAHPGLTRLHVVDTMHQRKALMEQLSDAFIAMPGGFGTFEEILEIMTWTQLGLHRKSAGFLNVAGYYEPLLEQLRKGFSEGFIPKQLASAIVSRRSPERLLAALLEHQPPLPTVKWISREQT
ncbi:MAG: LOG family protein [Myxococcaceae bacterium]